MTSIPVRNIKIKAGKVQPVQRKSSVSEKIRKRKSKRVRVKRRTAE